MANRIDIEFIMTDLKALLVANLNTKIAAVQSDKNDGMVLKTVTSDAYYIQDVNSSQAMAHDPFVYMGVDEVDSKGIEAATSKIYSIPILLVLADNGQDAEIHNRMYRYWRSLEETIEENYHMLNSGIKINMKSLTPVSMLDQNSSNISRVVGVMIQVAIA